MTAADLFPNRHQVRAGLLRNVSGLSDAELEWVPPGGKNAISFYLRHLSQSEDWFVNQVILRNDRQPRRSRDLPNRAALLDYLQETRAITETHLPRWDLDYLAQPRTMPEGFRGTPPEHLNVLWVVNQVFNHEAYHWGQTRLQIRLMGGEPGRF